MQDKVDTPKFDDNEDYVKASTSHITEEIGKYTQFDF